MTVGPLLAASLEPLAHCESVARFSLSIGYTLVDVNLNCLNWSHFLMLKGGILVILIDCVISLSSFLDVTRSSMSTVSFVPQRNSGIPYLLNAFL